MTKNSTIYLEKKIIKLVIPTPNPFDTHDLPIH